MKTKIAVVTAVVALGLAGWFGPKLLNDSKEKASQGRVVSKQTPSNAESPDIPPSIDANDTSGIAKLTVRVVWKDTKAPIAGT